MEKLYKDVKVVPKIQEISIRNEGIIKKADIRFQEGLNIIKGRNATGKTTVLRAIEKQSLTEKYPGKCFLIDDLSGVSYQERNKILEKIAESGNQAVITLAETAEMPEIKANVIDTSSFELRWQK